MKKQKVAKKKGTMSRLLAYIVKDHKIMFSIVLFCILVSSLTSVVSTIFIKVVIDNYIEPIINGNTDGAGGKTCPYSGEYYRF